MGDGVGYRLGVWANYTDLNPLHSGNLTISPWDMAVPANNEIHTFGIAAVTESGRRGPATLVTAGVWRNLMQHSDDPDGWGTSRVSVTSGALVPGPIAGTQGRAITFAANIGQLYGTATVIGALTGRTFGHYVYLRAPAGKAKIMLVAYTNIGGIRATFEVSLTNVWQRFSLAGITVAAGDTALMLGLDNRSAVGSLSDPSAGVVEVFGAMVVETGFDTTYQSRP